MESTIDLSAVQALVEVARAGGFAAAGRRLGVPRSTLSRQIQRLEAQLGARLLQRTTRSVRLTEAGREYFLRCDQGLALISAANQGAREAGSQPRGTLRVSAAYDLARDALAPLLPEFRRRYPDIALELEITQRRVDLVAEGIDLALRGGGPLKDSGLVVRKLGPSSLGLYASADYLAARGVPETPGDLSKHDVIAFRGDPAQLSGPEGALTLPPSWLRANEFSFLRLAVEAGLGIGLLESFNARCARAPLTRVLPEYALRGAALYAVYPSARRVPAKVRVFVDFLAKHLRGFAE